MPDASGNCTMCADECHCEGLKTGACDCADSCQCTDCKGKTAESDGSGTDTVEETVV